MVKVKPPKNYKQSPLLEQLVHNIRSSVKGLQCPIHPTEDSTVTMRLVNNRSEREIQACCYNFETTIREAINSGHTGA